jgi:filamentous hemagglutinin family protein
VRTARASFAASIEFGRWLFCHRVRMPFVDRKSAAAFAVAILLGAPPALAQTLPTGGSVAAGGVSIVQPNTTTLNVNQSTNQAIINWNTFSVGRGDTVNFNQPGASSSTLNRVTSSTPSWIAGVINAPGTVLLINPNGIEITKSGVINTGSFAASTLNIKDSDYLSGNYSFSGNGASAGVINNGRINVADGGFAALLGGQVSNNGVIAARLGMVALGAGEMATLDLTGDGFLSVAIPSSQLGNLVNANGALVSNKGKILANGGTVFLSAATASNILRNAVNSGGLIRTNSVGVHNGKIVINGGGGNVSVTGRLVANGGRRHNGGTVTILGKQIKVSGRISTNGKSGGDISILGTDNVLLTGTLMAQGLTGQGGDVDVSAYNNVSLVGASIDASGATGGGLVRIGGTFQGGNGDPTSSLYQEFIGRFGTLPAIPVAQTVGIDAATKINVSALNSGNAGTAVVWAEQSTDFSGSIFATGGPNGGNGGFLETSGKLSLSVLDSAYVDTLAPLGTVGNWLLDPENIVIQTGGSGTAITSDPYSNNATGTDTIAPSAIQGAATNVTLQASTDITINSAITMTNSVLLTLNAGRSILVNANITSKGGFTATIDDTNAISADRAPGQAAFTMAANTSISTMPTSAGNGGAVSITTGTLAADSTGPTSLAANIGNITLAAITTSGLGGASTAGAGGNVTITDSQGNIYSAATGTVTLAANGVVATSGTAVGKAGGTIQLTATNGAIGSTGTSLGAISANGGNGLGGNSGGGNGGAVTLTAGTSIWDGAITSTGGARVGTGTAGTIGAIAP